MDWHVNEISKITMNDNELSPRFVIFCDGGLGNRINALISGLAVARHFQLSYRVHWPVNNWCAAAFSDIFSNLENVSTDSLKKLTESITNSYFLLHDEIAAQTLGVTFESAYGYSSLDDFQVKAIASCKTIFYYPALIPQWIPTGLIHGALQTLKFTDHIQSEVTNFISQTLKSPFHGLHLRRTDLKIGFTDHEVLTLVTQHPDAVFFVCSDDPVAEALASAHPHVHRRTKTDYVEKKQTGEAWISQTKDDDGRIYNGNIQRSKTSVIEGAIDLLILAHSGIIGYSGSTFQSIARMIGEFSPLSIIDKPPALTVFSGDEIKRQVQSRLINSNLLLKICNTMNLTGNQHQAIELLQFSVEYFKGNQLNDIWHTLGIYCLNKNYPKLASIYLNEVTSTAPERFVSWLYLSYAAHMSHNFEMAQTALAHAKLVQPVEIQDSEIFLLNILNEIYKIKLVNELAINNSITN